MARCFLFSGFQFEWSGFSSSSNLMSGSRNSHVAIQNGPVRVAIPHGRHQHVHARLDEYGDQNAQNGPQRRAEIRLVEHRRQGDGSQHGTVSVETVPKCRTPEAFMAMSTSSASAEPIAAHSAAQRLQRNSPTRKQMPVTQELIRNT